MATLLFFITIFHIMHQFASSEQFIFNGFHENTNNIILDQASFFEPSGAIRLTNTTQNLIGHAFYSKPIQMSNQTSKNASSFTTTFVFSIVAPASGKGGFGLAFALSPSPNIPRAAGEHYLGLFNASTNAQSSNHIFVVEFDMVNGFNEYSDQSGNHVGINSNSMRSEVSKLASYRVNNTLNEEDVDLHDGKPIQTWIEYDGVKKTVNVTICPLGLSKPIKPLISHRRDLTPIVKEIMYVGFSASTGDSKDKASSHYILGWSFSTTGDSPVLDLSKLPVMVPPIEKDSSSDSFSGKVVALIAALCVVTVFLVGIVCVTFYKRTGRFESLEAWELECPHRFRYQDLYAATKGFNKSEIIGVGGFGMVYKAVMHCNVTIRGNEVAVKKITRNSIEGFKEFASEIESLGRLRHKHLVNLQGWCKKKNDLFLVYDYIPFGSLDKLLFNKRNSIVLTWEQRFNIAKGIAAGLLYLHEEWEQVVIHRDVKSSNVLIDAEMNGRLGDFGLARLFDHGTMSHTTNVVGTIGYISPEMARTGKASASSDVFAYGILLLEIGTGRRPIELGQFILADWVMENANMGRILDVVDPKLDSNYIEEEMELLLRLGLVCSHEKAEERPSMRQVIRYLDGDDTFEEIEDLSCNNSRLLNVSSADLGSSYQYSSTSATFMSTSSIDAGR
ncbi:receptor lectin kinase [Euphorbia peplus]|nr:receptor lectin kinase [Euphorbia peplus]